MIKNTENTLSFSKGFKKLFKTNPVHEQKRKKNLFEKFEKIQIAQSRLNDKALSISNIVEYIYSMPEQDIFSLFSYPDEIIRCIAVRAYVDKEPQGLIETLKSLLKDRTYAK